MPLSQVSIWYLKLVTSRVPSGLASRQRGAHVLPAGTYLGKQCPPLATAVPADAAFGLVEAMGHPAVRRSTAEVFEVFHQPREAIIALRRYIARLIH